MSEPLHEVRLQVNGVAHDVAVPARRLLSDALRHDVCLTGTHVGCEHGVCGACTVLVDGRPVRSCLMFAVSAVGCEITTVEGLTKADGSPEGRLGPVQQAFLECHGLQCGFCTPGFLTTITAGLEANPSPSEDEARDMIAGNLCRCTGYQNIVKSVLRAAEITNEVSTSPTGVGDGSAGGDGGPGSGQPGYEERDDDNASTGLGGMTTKLFGARVQRVEDQRFLRGQGRYVDDVAVGPHTLHAAVLRSPHAHAKVLDVHVEDVLDLEGVHAVWTYEDLAGLAPAMADPLPLLIPHPTLTHGRTQYALANGEVNYMGEAIAFVVADDRYVAEDAVGRIRVDYEVLRPVVGIEASRAATHLVHEDVPGNVGARMEQSNGDAPAAIANAPHRLSLDLTVERSSCQPMEGRGTVARWDPDVNRLTVWSSTQTSTGVRAAIAVKLGLDLGQVDVVTPDVGGGFGVKINHPWPEELLVPLAARALGRPVKFIEDRREHFISSAHERGQVHHVEVGFDDEGRLLGLDVEFWHDHGAYTPYGLIVPIITSTQLLGPYKPGAYRVRFESLYTNTVIVTPYRGAGRPQGCFVMERTMDAIAAFLGKDRAEVRATNFIQPDEFPYDQGLIFQDGRQLEYDSGDYPASLEKIKALVGWDEFPAYKKRLAKQGRTVGIGLACYVEGTGVGPYEGAHVHIETSGKVKVATGLTTQGQGHATVFAQIAADVLGVPLEDVEVVTGDTRRMPYAVGTFASRAAVMSGSAIHLAATRAREKVLKIAADALEASEDDLQIVDGVVSVKGAPSSSIALGTIAVLSNPLRYAFDEQSQMATQFSVGDPGKPPVAEDEEPGLEGKDFYSPERATFASGMHAVIVETDPLTAEIKILKYAVVHDCGHLINPMIVEGQIHGGVAQGVGGALYERMAYDESGQLLNASFMDFLMPYVTEVPTSIEIDHLETPSPLNPLGIKGAGEAGVIPSAAVFAAAISDAEGFSITAMPISPSELFALRQSMGQARLEDS